MLFGGCRASKSKQHKTRNYLNMDSKINFAAYSLNELYSSAATIDRGTYPERAKEIDELILQKEAELPEEFETSKNEGEKATRSDRFVAAMIDAIIGIISITPVIYYFGFDSLISPTLLFLAGLFIYGLFTTAILHGYLLYYYGQTIGKNYMSIRIENLDGTQAKLSTIYFKRMLPMQLLGLIPALGQVISGVINPLFIFSKDKRCLHDYLAKTKVSYTEA